MQQVNKAYPDLKVDEVEIVQSRHFLLQGKKDGQPIVLRIYDDGTVQDLSAMEIPPQRPTAAKQENKPVVPTEEAQPPLPGHIDQYPDDDFEREMKPLLGD